MKQSKRIVIEESILKVTNELLQEWRGKFKKFSVYSDFPFVSRTGSEATYFSEIEVNYWHEDGAFIDFFSIIIFIQGEQVLNIDEARSYIEEEIQNCYDRYIHKINLKQG